MIQKILCFLAACYFVFFVTGAIKAFSSQQTDVYSLMKAVVNAKKQLVYEGKEKISFETKNGTKEILLKIYHDGSRQRLEYVSKSNKSKPYRIVISNDINTYYLRPGKNLLIKESLLESHLLASPISEKNLLIEESLPDKISLELDRLHLSFENYKWEIIKSEELIGHTTLLIKARPKWQFGNHYYFWVDPDKRLILKNEYYNEDEKLILTASFTSLRIVDKLPQDLFETNTQKPEKKQILTSKKLSKTTNSNQFNFVPNIPETLPYGYILEGQYIEVNKGKEQLRLAYTDGLDTVSLFEMPYSYGNKKNKNKTKNHSSLISVYVNNPPWKVLNWQNDGLRYTLIGTNNLKLMQNMAQRIIGKPVEFSNKTNGVKGLLHYFQRGLQHLFGN